MVGLFAIIGILGMLSGVFFFAVAASAIHEILGGVVFGVGLMALGFSALLSAANRATAQLEEMRRDTAATLELWRAARAGRKVAEGSSAPEPERR